MPIYANPYRWDRFSSRTIKSTDNIRLREMTVGYTLPVLKKHISNFRIYFRANNLAMLWSKTKNIDPDVAIRQIHRHLEAVYSALISNYNL